VSSYDRWFLKVSHSQDRDGALVVLSDGVEDGNCNHRFQSRGQYARADVDEAVDAVGL
jgi:hypothetical protein